MTPLTVQLDEEQSLIETISVVREPGLFGTVQINWRTIPDPTFPHSVTLDNLLVASFGSVLFQPNITTASIEIQLRPDSVCVFVCVCVCTCVRVYMCACMHKCC